MNRLTTVSEEDRQLVIALKSEGILLKFNPEEFRSATKNGGFAFMCVDGDTDTFDHHAGNLTHRPHCMRISGGPMFLARSFRGYDTDFGRSFATDLKANLKLGMMAKDTKRVCLYFHAPCGVATHYAYGIREQLGLAAEARDFLATDNFFIKERIFAFFHVKKINPKGELEQNTYRIDL